MRAHAKWVSLVAGFVIGASAVPGAAAERDLIAAVKAGQVLVPRQLAQQRRDINATEVDGTTALMWAVRNGDQQSEALLLTAGANANAVNRYGVTALSLAASTGNLAALGRAGLPIPDGFCLDAEA